MGMKPSDRWTIPLCGVCHRYQHQHGESSFYRNIEAARELANGLYLFSGDEYNALSLIAKKRQEMF
jgi:hypothetical protein